MATAAVFHGQDSQLTLEQIQIPSLGPGQVLVRILACALCRSDLHTISGRRVEPTPTILGHETVGVIEAFGPGGPTLDAGGEPLSVGSRITWAIFSACEDCFFCVHGLPQKCSRLFKYGHQKLAPDDPLSGGLASHIILRQSTSIHLVPQDVKDHVASLANCSTSTAAAALRAASQPGTPLHGATIALFGAGVLGLTAAAMARDLGANKVWVIDVRPESLARAERFGAIGVDADNAHSVILSETEGRGCDIAIELSGALPPVRDCLSITRIGGTVVLVGTVSPVGTFELDPEKFVRKSQTLVGVHNYNPSDLDNALKFLGSTAYPMNMLIGATYPLDQINAAAQTAESSPGTRIIVTP